MIFRETWLYDRIHVTSLGKLLPRTHSGVCDYGFMNTWSIFPVHSWDYCRNVQRYELNELHVDTTMLDYKTHLLIKYDKKVKTN